MVLHHGHNHLVALLHKLLTERRHHEIESLGSAAGEDNLIHRRGIDKAAHCLSCGLMEVGGLLGEIMHSTMHIGIHIEILNAHGIEHAERFLGGGGIIEINQRFVIYRSRQYREILPYLLYIKHTLFNVLFTQLTSLALAQFSAEALLHQMMKTIPQGLEPNGVDDLIDKCKLK